MSTNIPFEYEKRDKVWKFFETKSSEDYFLIQI